MLNLSLRLACTLLVFLGSIQRLHAESGAEIFKAKCASCHGMDGQGVADEYDEPLFGESTITELAGVIEKTMPEGDADKCVGDDAKKVAEYIHGEFYSHAARIKKGYIAAPRIELTRLTVPQYRNAIADLLLQFTPERSTRMRRGRQRSSDSPSSDRNEVQPGLRAEYFQSKGMSKADKLRFDRVERRIEFDFGDGSPDKDIAPDQFAIIWQGALVAPYTGYYEFRVITPNGARLYLNLDQSARRQRLRDDSAVAGQTALIDAWVSSGKMRESTARVYLLGGRQYPIRLEFFKYKEKVSSIKLEWKPPHGAWKILDRSSTNTSLPRRTFVVETGFPPDDRSLGYERGNSISREWLDAVANAAIATANEVANRLPLFLGVNDNSPEFKDKQKEFVIRFAATAFRRPLTEKEVAFFRSVPDQESTHLETAIRRTIILILTSPHFLYLDLEPNDSHPNQHVIASRLSFALWDSIPDKQLAIAARTSELETADQINHQVERMLSDPRAKAKMQGFFQHWLELEERDLAKDSSLFPNFDESVVADLRRSLEIFVAQVVWSERSDFRQLLLANYLMLNDRLQSLYVPDREENSPEVEKDTIEFQRVEFSNEQRAGVLTHPYLLSAQAYHNNSSPIHRGVFLTRNIVGRALKPPPVAVAFKDDEFAEDLTMREKITQLTQDANCMSCHSIINPLGYALENYDAVGRWRTNEKNKPIDSKVSYHTRNGQTLEFQNAHDIARFAVENREAQRAFINQLFQHFIKQNSLAYPPDTIENLRKQFEKDDFNIRNTLARIAVIAVNRRNSIDPFHKTES